ncbi:hypothetical protein PC128_g8032 [Phytophthora cactorum]|nr:hypothetical protein PC128_g8032 [Phytophthora cactorum]
MEEPENGREYDRCQATKGRRTIGAEVGPDPGNSVKVPSPERDASEHGVDSTVGVPRTELEAAGGVD